MQKDDKKKKRAYKASILLKYWKANNEPLMDLCMIIAMYAQDIEYGLLYAVGWMASITIDRNTFKSIDILSRIILKNKDGEDTLVKCVRNGGNRLHAFLLENGTVRVVENNKSTFDIALKSDIITMNSGNCCNSLFILDAKMRAYEIKNGTPTRVTGLPNEIKIKDISCGCGFTVFLSKCGRVLGMGLNENGALGLPRRIKKTEIPTEITFPNQSDLDKNGIIITMIYTGGDGWVAMDYKQRAWIIGNQLMQSVRNDYGSLDPCIDVVGVWHLNKIEIVQIKCGVQYVIALDTEGRVHWFGRFNGNIPLSHVSLDPIPFSHRIISIRSGSRSVACKDTTNEWYVWGWNTWDHITGLCGCKSVCKEAKRNDIISNPMRCEWQGILDSTHVINLQLGFSKAHVIVDSV